MRALLLALLLSGHVFGEVLSEREIKAYAGSISDIFAPASQKLIENDITPALAQINPDHASDIARQTKAAVRKHNGPVNGSFVAGVIFALDAANAQAHDLDAALASTTSESSSDTPASADDAAPTTAADSTPPSPADATPAPAADSTPPSPADAAPAPAADSTPPSPTGAALAPAADSTPPSPTGAAPAPAADPTASAPVGVNPNVVPPAADQNTPPARVNPNAPPPPA